MNLRAEGAEKIFRIQDLGLQNCMIGLGLQESTIQEEDVGLKIIKNIRNHNPRDQES